MEDIYYVMGAAATHKDAIYHNFNDIVTIECAGSIRCGVTDPFASLANKPRCLWQSILDLWLNKSTIVTILCAEPLRRVETVEKFYEFAPVIITRLTWAAWATDIMQIEFFYSIILSWFFKIIHFESILVGATNHAQVAPIFPCRKIRNSQRRVEKRRNAA